MLHLERKTKEKIEKKIELIFFPVFGCTNSKFSLINYTMHKIKRKTVFFYVHTKKPRWVAFFIQIVARSTCVSTDVRTILNDIWLGKFAKLFLHSAEESRLCFRYRRIEVLKKENLIFRIGNYLISPFYSADNRTLVY